MTFLLSAIGLLAMSGVPGLCWRRRSEAGQWLATVLAVAGGGLGIAGAWPGCFAGQSWELRLPWSLPGGEFHIALDGLAAVFLLPIFLIALLGSVYGLGYWSPTEHPENARKLRFFYGLLPAAMALLVLARNAILFLTAWEVMALSAFFLVATEDEEEPVRAAGWLYLAAAHVATLCLFALFALLRSVTTSFTLEAPAADALTPGLATGIFLLAVVGFGLKAGIMPFHFWLPSSHAMAPSHVSALMSGVILKMGIYGLIRTCSLLPHPPLWWGGLLLGLGVVSGILGVAFAIGQHDLKRLLAYHSIENIGIIVMGFGLAMVGRSLQRPDWVVLGLGGALLHVWNHALFKSLLFLSAGSVIHATHTRAMDRLGGLAKTMPATAVCFLIGAVAISGLPPLNGFVSELLIYLGLFRTLGIGAGPSWVGGAFAVPALALIGTLAAACFVKAYGTVFLGVGRSEHAAHVREAGPAMIGPMIILSSCCVVIGLGPGLVAPALEQAIRAWDAKPIAAAFSLEALAPLAWVGRASLLLTGFMLAGAVLLGLRVRAQVPGPAVATWDCGYVAPSPRMQYTSSSFAQMLVDWFAWALRPQTRPARLRGVFPAATHFHRDVPDPVLEEAVLPGVRGLTWFASWFRVVQQGSLQAYLVYIFVILMLLLLWR